MKPICSDQTKSHTILIAEDDRELRDLLQSEFELEGLIVRIASNGPEAVEAAQKVRPDVILMDILMPLMNGIQATRILKQKTETRDIPVIMLTATGNREEIIEGLDAGAIDYITKPFFMPELKARVRSVLQLKITADELKRIQQGMLANECLRTIREMTGTIQSAVSEPLTVLLGRIELLRRKQARPSEAELKKLERAARKIDEIVAHLGILECLSPEQSLSRTGF